MRPGQHPKVTISVILPAYNAARTIRASIHSVLMQTWRDFELIVVDDGSDDMTVENAACFTDQRLKIHRRPHHGVTETRNFGLASAAGEFITFIDADDLWLPEKLEDQLTVLHRNHMAGVAYSWTVLIDENARFLAPLNRVRFQGDVYADLLVDCFIASGSNIMFRRQCLENVGLFDQWTKSACDWDFFLRLASKWHFAVVPVYHVCYRLSADSYSSGKHKTASRLLRFARNAYADAEASMAGLKPRTLANIHLHLAFLYFMRAPSSLRVPKGWRALHQAVLARPQVLATRPFWFLAGAGLIQMMVPGPWQVRAARSLLRAYGHLAQLKCRMNVRSRRSNTPGR